VKFLAERQAIAAQNNGRRSACIKEVIVEVVRMTFMNDRESDGKVRGELLDELFSAFEDVETQSAGILQFLKEKGLATDEELARYLKQAGDASEVRWRAARLRMDALLAAAIRDAEEEFARKMEERARAQEESTVQKQVDRGESEQKGANDARAVPRNPDARKEEDPRQTLAPNAAEEDVAKDKTQAMKATKDEKEKAETDGEAGARKGTSGNGGNDTAESKTVQKAA
jgi:hypothetical protein